ncbi:hypothetical protein SAMN06313486_10141 [Epsilonproteobacteria bacterium SCGC AD-308-P11]|jgi:hypothetical protein|nr:hypothetical protein SAMN06313486_10141 [Epsilonproteobacteria bacterium SCGC AD-308-P11]
MTIDIEDLETIRYAKSLLEGESFAIKATNFIGKPIEIGLGMLPEKANKTITKATNKALNVALKAAVVTMSKKPTKSSWEKMHKLACDNCLKVVVKM